MYGAGSFPRTRKPHNVSELTRANSNLQVYKFNPRGATIETRINTVTYLLYKDREFSNLLTEVGFCRLVAEDVKDSELIKIEEIEVPRKPSRPNSVKTREM